MANGWIEVKRNNPCPICGTHDFCAYRPADDGYGNVYLCKRYTMSRVTCPGSDTIGHDGAFYLLVGESSSGSGVYRNANDVQKAEQNGFHIYTKERLHNDQKVTGPDIRQDIVSNVNDIASDDVLDEFYRAIIRKLPLCHEDEEYLRHEGWSDELIHSSDLCSFPIDDWRRRKVGKIFPSHQKNLATICREIIDELHVEPVGIPGFFQKEYNGNLYWTLNSRSGIGFPLKNHKGQIVRIRIRMNYKDSWDDYIPSDNKYFLSENNYDGKKRFMIPWKGVFVMNPDNTMVQEKEKRYRGSGKYRPLTSFFEKKDGTTVINGFHNGTEATNICGMVSHQGNNPLIAIATEGEKKGIKGNHSLNMPTIILPGVTSHEKLFSTRVGKNILLNLTEKGMKYIAIAFDADKASNENVLKCEKAFAENILKHGYGCIIVNWDAKYGKGLDDAIMHHANLRFFEIKKDMIEKYYANYRLTQK